MGSILSWFRWRGRQEALRAQQQTVRREAVSAVKEKRLELRRAIEELAEARRPKDERT